MYEFCHTTTFSTVPKFQIIVFPTYMSFKISFMYIAFVTDVTLIASHVAEISQDILNKSATIYFK